MAQQSPWCTGAGPRKLASSLAPGLPRGAGLQDGLRGPWVTCSRLRSVLGCDPGQPAAQGPRVPGVPSPFPANFPMTPDIPLDLPLRQTGQQGNGNTGRAALSSGLGEGWWELPWLGVPRRSSGLQTKAGPDLGLWGSWNETDSGPIPWLPLAPQGGCVQAPWLL